MAGVKDIRAAVEAARARARRRGGRRCCFSMRCIASTRRSRTPFCRTSRTARSPSSARPPRIPRSRWSARCCRGRGCTCCAHCRSRICGAAAQRAAGRGARAWAASISRPSRRRSICMARAADGDARRALNMLELGGGLAEAAGSGAGADARDGAGGGERRAAGASTRAATSSTTRSLRCTRRCAAPIRTRRFTGCAACSMAAAIRCTSRDG